MTGYGQHKAGYVSSHMGASIEFKVRARMTRSDAGAHAPDILVPELESSGLVTGKAAPDACSHMHKSTAGACLRPLPYRPKSKDSFLAPRPQAPTPKDFLRGHDYSYPCLHAAPCVPCYPAGKSRTQCKKLSFVVYT